MFQRSKNKNKIYEVNIYEDQASDLNSTLISIPLGIVMLVTSLILEAGHSRSTYLLKTVISKLSQVFEPSPQGVLLQQILKCLLGSLTGPLILTSDFLAFSTKLLVTACIDSSLFPEKVILALLTSWSSMTSFLVSFSAIILDKLIFTNNALFPKI